MALFDDDNEERTETATAFRREEFRKQGSVALSREVLSVSVLLVIGGAMVYGGPHVQLELSRLFRQFFAFDKYLITDKKSVLEMGPTVLKSWFWVVAPVFIAGMVAAFVAAAAQVGFFVTWEPISPKWERINPITGFNRIFSSNGAMEGGKAVGKLVIGSLIFWNFLKSSYASWSLAYQKSIPEIVTLVVSTLSRLFYSLLSAYVIVAILDYFFQKFRLEKQMKMTRREAKEEFKMREGDPLVKSRIRSIQRRIASRRMMEAVPKADVIVTNPTHLAVALKYDAEEMRAPRVIAKGAGLIADKIRELAKFHQIPIVENKPLARTLYKELEIGEYIPRELYKAVAEILAYVFRLKNASRYQAA